MKLFKIMKIDLYLGVWKKWRFLVFVGICFLACSSFWQMAQSYTANYGEMSFTMADCLAFVLKGAPEMRGKSLGEEFFLPPIWLILILMCLMMPLDYPVRSMENWGSQYLIRTNRKSWWISKCIYVIGTNTITYGVYLSVTALFCVWKNVSLSFENNGEFYQSVFGEVLERALSLSSTENSLLLVVIPLLGLYAMSLLQLFVSVWLSPLMAYILSVVILVFSVYAEVPWLIGNHTMAIRSGLINAEGIRISDEIRCSLFLCAVIVIAGLLCIHRKDMLVLKKEEL